MPGTRVPTYETPQVQAGPLPGARAQAPSGLATAFGQEGRYQQEIGQGVEKAGGVLADIQLDMQNQANTVRVQDALNQSRQAALDLTYNPENGYQSLKGSAALNRDSGLPLPVEYGDKLKDKMNSITENLGNDAQRQLFNKHSADITNSFNEGLQRHTLDQFKTYQSGVAEDAIKLGETQAGLQWNDPQAVESSVESVKAAAYQQANLKGIPASAAIQTAESNVRTKVIEQALENNNPGYAMSYFNKFKGDGSGKFGGLTPDDILKVQGKINTQMDSHIALSAVNDAVKQYQPAIAPTNMDRMYSITEQSESSGRRFDQNGALLSTTSASGKVSRGEMQVQDGTNKKPGFGVKPAQDDSPDERRRVGRDYLGAMVQRYGGADKAWAAYNAGPGAVDDAVEQAKIDGKPAEWLSYLPDETRDYVAKNTLQLQTGNGAPVMPTKMDFVNAAVKPLGDNARPQVIKLTTEQAEKQFELIQTSRKEVGEQALQAAQKALIENKGQFAQLPPSIIEGLTKADPENYEKAQKFAEAIAKGGQVTNMDAYARAVTYPDELAKMSDATFLQFIKTNFTAADQEKIAKIRANEINSTTDDSAGAINGKAVNAALNERLTAIGINPTPDKKDMDSLQKIGGIQKFVRDDIYDQQHQLGRKLTPDEIEKRVDGLFVKQVITPGLLWGTNSKPVMSIEIGDVPSTAKDIIKSFLATKGNTNPNDTDILNLYRAMEMRKK